MSAPAPSLPTSPTAPALDPRAGILRRARGSLLLAQVVLGAASALGAWLLVPHLFFLDTQTVAQLRLMYSGLVGGAMVVAGIVSWVATSSLGKLAVRLEDGLTTDPQLLERTGRLFARLPTMLGVGTVGAGLVVSLAVAFRGHTAFDVPLNTTVVAGIYGACIVLWLAVMIRGSTRLILVPTGRVLSSLGVEGWPGRRGTLSHKIALPIVMAALIPAVLVAAAAHHFADTALAQLVAEETSQRLPVLLEGAMRQHAAGAPAEQVARQVRLATQAFERPVVLGLVHRGRVVAGEAEALGPLLQLYAFRNGGHRSDSTILPDTLDIAVWRPASLPGYILLARIDRRLIEGRLAPYTATIIGLLAVALVLGATLAWTTMRTLHPPMVEVVRETSRVSEGDLRSMRMRVLTDDELGDLADRVQHMRGRLASTVGRVVAQSARVDAAARSTLVEAADIATGARNQHSAVESAVSSVTEMDASLRSVAETVHELAGIFHEGRAAAGHIGDDFDRVAHDVEALAQGALDAARAVTGLSDGNLELAREVSGLSGVSMRATNAVDEMELALRYMREHARGAAGSAQETMSAAQEGAVNVRRTVEGIKRISETAEAAAQRVEDLSSRIAGVSRVLSVIDDITEKTSLLALNASIIAAQAGEHGRSFAVVASEVRDLATRTAASTREIAGTVRDVQEASADVVKVIRASSDRVAEGVELASAAENSLSQILLTVAAGSKSAGEIAEASQGQADMVGRVSAEIEQVASMAERIASVARRQAGEGSGARAAVDDIAMLNAQMNDAVGHLADRNRGLLTAFGEVGAHIDRVERALAELVDASRSILREGHLIQDVAEASGRHAGSLQGAARELDEAAQALIEEMRFFRTDEVS